jgi:diguanylate cyclase (GGDEF)-like protein
MRKVYAEVTRMGENDSLGHEAGDALLQVIGARLVELTRRSDLLARIGGDEFAIALPDVTNALDAQRLPADKIKVDRS